MKKSILILFLLSLITLTASAQIVTYLIVGKKQYEEIPNFTLDYRLDSLLVVKNYPAFLSKIYSKDRAILHPKELYSAAVYFDEINQPDSTFSYLSAFLIVATDDRSILFHDYFPNLKKNNTYWPLIINQLEKNYLKEIPDIENKELALQIFYLSIEKYRTELPYTELNLYQIDSLTKKGELNQQRKENITKTMDAIIEKYGFPTMQMVGKFAVYQSYDILNYTNRLTKQYPEIQKSYLQKGIEPELYAQITDKYLVLKGKKQMYGTIFRSCGTKYDQKYPGAFILSPVENFKELNKRRLEMGLIAIEEYVIQHKNENLVIPQEYYK
jgi:hypothetical protein